MAGSVFSNEKKLAKAGDLLDEDAPLEVRGRDHPWVSRGGIKLDHGLDHFGVDAEGAIAVDIGSSTGGFTDVLLSRGARRVYAVDVGTNQLAWKLRQDQRVMVHEKTNARTLDRSIVSEPVDIIVCDVSFIGLAKVLEAPLKLGKAGTKLIALIKPQFEAGRQEIGKGGVVRDPLVHERVCKDIADWVRSQGWKVLGITPSPITGPEGNIEFLLAAEKFGDS